MKSVSVLPLWVALLSSIAGAVQIDVDTSQAPDLANFGATIKSTLESKYNEIRDYLNSPSFVDIQRIPIFFDPSYDGVAYAGGGRIVGSVNYYREHQSDVGSMIHEMVHIIQGYRNGPGWLTEGIADYVRYYQFEPDRKPNKPGRDHYYTEGYGVSAYFLNYIQTQVGNMIYWSNKDCREGTYDDNMWPRLTGLTLDQHWNNMQDRG